MPRALRIGSQGYGHDIVLRLSGLKVAVVNAVAINRFPDFPLGIDTAAMLDCGGMGDGLHICEHEPVIHLPTILVLDVRLSHKDGKRYRSEIPVVPFHTGRAMVMHEGMCNPDSSLWKCADMAAAVCALGANPWLESVRFLNPSSKTGSSQVYVLNGEIIIQDDGSGFGHHKLYVSRECPEYRNVLSS